MVMWIAAQHSGDWNWNHSPCEEYALHPQLLEALETTIHAGLALIETDIMLTPFCLERKSLVRTKWRVQVKVTVEFSCRC